MDEAALERCVQKYSDGPPVEVTAVLLEGLSPGDGERLRAFLQDIGGTVLSVVGLGEDVFPMGESPIDEAESALHARLDETIEEGLASLPPDPLHATMVRKLVGVGRIVTLRDLVVRARSGTYNVRGFNKDSKSTKIIEDLLADRLGPGFVWPESPSIETIARACSSLSQVNAGVVAPHCAGFTIRQVLDMTPEDRVLHLSDKSDTARQRNEVKQGIADESSSARLYIRFQAVAEEFRRTRAKMRLAAAGFAE